MEPTTENIVVKDNPEARRFEAAVGEHLAVAEYDVSDEGMRFYHTEVPPELGGKGVGSKLAQAGLQACRDRGLQAMPDCSFIAGYIRKHPECHDLVHPRYREQLGISQG
jgi:predicted GNAT family acetyltransferase